MTPMLPPRAPQRFRAPDAPAGTAARCVILPTNSPQPTTLPDGLTVKGDVFADQDLVLAGRVDGSVDIPNHNLSIMQGARLEGPAFARLVSVAGTIVGDITASELVEILPGGRVQGSITAPHVYLDEQGFFSGRIDMRRADAAVRVARYRLEQRKTVGG